MKAQIIWITAFVCLLFASCEHDNFDEPNATISGKVLYNGNPVGVRTNGTQLELWQEGYQLFTKIPVYIAHDGTFSASVFNGRYKIVRLAGAPWEAQTGDTIVVDVKGSTVIEVPVTPYFIVKNESFRKDAGTITSTFTIDKIVETANVVSVNLYLGKNILTDHNKNENDDSQDKYQRSLDLSQLAFGQEITMTSLIPEALINEDYIFARLGVRSNQSNEYYYTQVQKISLK